MSLLPTLQDLYRRLFLSIHRRGLTMECRTSWRRVSIVDRLAVHIFRLLRSYKSKFEALLYLSSCSEIHIHLSRWNLLMMDPKFLSVQYSLWFFFCRAVRKLVIHSISYLSILPFCFPLLLFLNSGRYCPLMSRENCVKLLSVKAPSDHVVAVFVCLCFLDTSSSWDWAENDSSRFNTMQNSSSLCPYRGIGPQFSLPFSLLFFLHC